MGKPSWASAAAPSLREVLTHHWRRLFGANSRTPNSTSNQSACRTPGGGGALPGSSPRVQNFHGSNVAMQVGLASPRTPHARTRDSLSFLHRWSLRPDRCTVLCLALVLCVCYAFMQRAHMQEITPASLHPHPAVGVPTHVNPPKPPVALTRKPRPPSNSGIGSTLPRKPPSVPLPHDKPQPSPARRSTRVVLRDRHTAADDEEALLRNHQDPEPEAKDFLLERVNHLDFNPSFPMDSTAESLLLKPESDVDYHHSYHVCTFTNVCVSRDALLFRFQNHTMWQEARSWSKKCNEDTYY
jgi:hypothetical protein